MADRTHTFHAEATILSGDLKHPLKQQIKPQTNVKLSAEGGYLSEHAEPYRLEGVISFSKAYTQVSGHRDSKPGHGRRARSVTSTARRLDTAPLDESVRVAARRGRGERAAAKAPRQVKHDRGWPEFSHVDHRSRPRRQ